MPFATPFSVPAIIPRYALLMSQDVRDQLHTLVPGYALIQRCVIHQDGRFRFDASRSDLAVLYTRLFVSLRNIDIAHSGLTFEQYEHLEAICEMLGQLQPFDPDMEKVHDLDSLTVS